MKTYEFKLCPTRKTRYLDALLLIACDIYNEVLTTKQETYKNTKTSISLYDMQKLVQDRRNEGNSAWQLINAHAVRQIIDRIYNGYTLFFSQCKRGKKARPPRLKKHSKYQSITFPDYDDGWKLLEGNKIRIGGRKGRVFKYYKHRDIQGKVKTITVKRNRIGEWFIYITTDHQDGIQKQVRSGKSVGLDFGLHTFLTGNDGTITQSPLFFKKGIRTIRRLSKKLSNKVKGSNNRRRARQDLARSYDDIANQRRNFHWQLATELCRTYEVICLETLNLKGMKALWGRKVSDLGFYSFVQILQYQASKTGTRLIFIDQWYPSSKTCSACGEVNYNLNLRDREWDCPCGAHHQRDFNASVNIHRVGMSTLAGVGVRPSTSNRKGKSKKASGVDSTISIKPQG